MTFMSPLDLLTVSSHEQDVIRCLIRRPRLTLQEIAGFTKIPVDKLEGIVNSMVQESRLDKDGDSKFQVLLNSRSAKPERAASGFLESLFK